jgi:hypothetical protein
MKTLLSLLSLLLASCSSIDTTAVIESDTGIAHPVSHLDSLRGMASGKRDAEMMRFADALIAKAGTVETDDSGTLYPGTVRVLRWDEGRKYTAQRLAVFPDGSTAWQGPTPPSGFYAADLEEQILTTP